jgi:ABC-2 type transport system ATP-binding protein
VAILNHGQLIAQAPLEELLSGGDGAVYSLVISGDARQTLSTVESQSWVSGITASVADEGLTLWQVSVTDEEAAETELLRLVLADGQLKVMDWGRKKYELEEIFLDLVEGDDSGQ